MEAIKSSVEANLGVAFLSVASIEKEVELGRLRPLSIRGVHLSRTCARPWPTPALPLHCFQNPRPLQP